MSKQEMMRQSAKQKLAAEKHERAWTEALEKTAERLNHLEETLAGLQETIESQASNNRSPVEESLEKKVEALLTTMIGKQIEIQRVLERLDFQEAAKSSLEILERAKEAQENAKELQTSLKSLNKRVGSTVAASQKHSDQIREAMDLLEKEPAMLREVSIKAQNRIMKASDQMMGRLEKRLMFLGLKALGVGVVCTILTLSLTVLTGWWWLDSRGETIEVMGASEEQALARGQTLNKRLGEVSDEDRATLMRIVWEVDDTEKTKP